MTPLFTLHIPIAGCGWITLNRNGRGVHWAVTKKRRDEWAEMTHYTWLQQGRPKSMPPARLESEFILNTNRTRDPHNFVATLKPIIDQLVTDRVWPDDNPRWLQVPEPKLTVHKASPLGVIVRAYPTET